MGSKKSKTKKAKTSTGSTTFKLKEGVILTPYGPNSSITEENLTDEIAQYLVDSGKVSLDVFESYPDQTTDDENPELNPENPEELDNEDDENPEPSLDNEKQENHENGASE